MKTADKSVIRPTGFCSTGVQSDPARYDIKDGKVVRIRPLHYSERYTKEDLNYYELRKGEHVFDQGFKSLLSPHAIANKKRIYSKNRIPYPLKRVDWDPEGERNPQNRGASKFERISWEEAIRIITDEIKRIDDTYGANSILVQGDGHGEDKFIQGAHGCNWNLMKLVGGGTMQARQPDSWEGWYWGAKHMWGMEPLGQQTANTMVIRDITENGDAVLFWGCDPETTPLGWGGQLPSRICYWFNEIGVKSIHIAPDVNYSNGIHADKWIPVLPNTDAALQLAIAYVWLTEGTYDEDYLATHAYGFDNFADYVLGKKEDGIAKTPEWASEKCGVPVYTIKALARYWARHRVSIAHCNGGGYIRSAYSHEPARLEVALLGMQAVGKPGANQFKFIEWNLLGMASTNPLPGSVKYADIMGAFHGWDLFVNDCSFVPKTLSAKALKVKEGEKLTWYGHTTCIYNANDQLTEFQFPLEGSHPIHMVWTDTPCWSTCWNNGNEFLDGLRGDNIEFVLAQHPWLENDALFADIILPVSTLIEVEDIGNDCGNGQVGLFFYCEPAIERRCESLSDYEICCEIARGLERFGGKYEGIYEAYTGGKTVEEWVKFGYDNSGFDDLITYDEFKTEGWAAAPVADGWQDCHAGLYDFWKDPENHPMTTPTGLIEYTSTYLGTAFPDDDVRGPYPKWIEEGDGHQERKGSERAKDYPFLLVSNHPRLRIHAQHDDNVWLREIETGKVTGPDGYAYEALWINPVDAAEYGIESGDVVAIYNERGTVLGGAYITERIMPGALYQDHGAHIDPIVAGQGGLDRGGANNLICPGAVASKNAAAEVTNSFLVGLKKVDVFELAKQYPKQFGRVHDAGCGCVPDSYLA